jgi:hypothetical protein
VNIIDALSDPQLLGAIPAFRDLTTWRAWLVFLKAFYGIAMDADELTLFRKHTGRDQPRPTGYAEAACVVGCQSGKSQIAAAVAAYESAITPTVEGRDLYVPLIAQDARGSLRVLLAYVKRCFEVPLLRGQIVHETSDTLELLGGVTVAVYPCRPQSIRGVGAPLVVIDEIAHFISTDGRPTDREMLIAARTRVAATIGRVLVLSSPYAASGALYDLHRLHYGQDSTTLVWQASAPEMNPTLSADYLERMALDDPDAYRSEVLGEFRSGVLTFIDPEALEAVVAHGVRERAPDRAQRYHGFTDSAGGRGGGDNWTAAVAHHDYTQGVAVLDALRTWKPPFNPSGVVQEASDFFKSYHLTQIAGDAYSAEFTVEQFRINGISYIASERDRSTIYLEFLPLLNSAKVSLLDIPELLREFRGLERRRGSSGKDRIDHGPRMHDDRANSAAAALVLAKAQVPVDLSQAYVPTVSEREAETAQHLAELGDTSGYRSPWDI